MDGSVLEHSDSDSGESWTLLEPISTESEDITDLPRNLLITESSPDYEEKDEDTDGISIISDSDRESLTPCDLGFDKLPEENSRPPELPEPKYVSVTPLPVSNKDDYRESLRDNEDFLSLSGGSKHKTYVHRKNKRLSTVLNIIVLGSFITAAGVAIGHMWGIKEDCKMQAGPSINKILSNLYKLQEENIYLRSKIKELSLLHSMMDNKKMDNERILNKQNKCKKVFEEPLNNKSANKALKCVDNENENFYKKLDSHLIEPEYEKEFLNDVDKLHNVYQQNKEWLDEEVNKRVKQEEEHIQEAKNQMKINRYIGGSHNFEESMKDVISKKQEDSSKDTMRDSKIVNQMKEIKQNFNNIIDESLENVSEASVTEKSPPNNKISYADSLKHEQTSKKVYKVDYRENKYTENKKNKRELNEVSDHSMLNDDIGKDDRYSGHKYKFGRKKNDRQKIQKRQKRKNKYEQWEMKDYMKDYDEDNNFMANDYYTGLPELKLRKSKQIFEPDLNNNFDKFKTNLKSEIVLNDENEYNKENIGEYEKRTQNKKERKNIKKNRSSENDNKKDPDWYEKRTLLRSEARKKLEREMFGENYPNRAGWYFRRMQKREQCRAKGDNSTYKKHSKDNWKFMKY